MSSFSKFKLDIPSKQVETPADSTFNHSSSTLFWDLAQPESLPTSGSSGVQKLHGNFLSDSQAGGYNKSWRSWEEFTSFLAQEQSSNSTCRASKGVRENWGWALFGANSVCLCSLPN
ncbi:hypothetical protein BDZ97DRAFT_1991889 [Flammula alnicola]|nr:hypothetical protein BDZ97DRAFT_1991889 [Flammula alnicola]